MKASQTVDFLPVHAHKRQLAWQILVPILAVTVLVIAVAVFITVGAASTTRTWADISLIWLIAPMLVFVLLSVIVAGFLIYGIARLLKIIPQGSSKVQEVIWSVSSGTRKIADGTVRPFFWFHQVGAVLKAIFK